MNPIHIRKAQGDGLGEILRVIPHGKGDDMGNLGFPEMIVILVVVMLFFGTNKLPELGKSMGKGIAEFKKALAKAESSAADEKNQKSRAPEDNSKQE